MTQMTEKVFQPSCLDTVINDDKIDNNDNDDDDGGDDDFCFDFEMFYCNHSNDNDEEVLLN